MSSSRRTFSLQDYAPLSEPIPIKEQSWPEDTKPMLCTMTFAFNHESYIRECLEGILMQKTTFPVRICVHDDASTDSTADIIREFQRNYPGKIWAYFQEVNTFRRPDKLKLQSTYRSWVESGKYIAMCEGDDYWLDPLKLQKQVEILEKNPEIFLCAHDVEIIHEDVLAPSRERFYDVPFEGSFVFDFKDYFSNHFFHTASKVYRVPNDVHKYHALVYSVFSADILVNQWFLSLGKGYYLADKMAFKRRNPRGFTNSSTYRDKGFRLTTRYSIMKEVAKFAPKEMQKQVHHELADIYRNLMKHQLNQRRFLHAIKSGILAAAYHPGWVVQKIFFGKLFYILLIKYI